MTSCNVIAIIPARSGSKRIPNKNCLPLGGKPMIAWTIQAALEASVIDQVLVSTDSESIAEIARAYGAEVPFLRKAHADAVSPVSQATLSALRQAEAYFACRFDTVVQLLPNCPLRSAADIVHSYQYFQAHASSFQISCFSFFWMNPWWAMKLSETGHPTPIFADALTSRSQDLPDLYCPTGAIWIANRDDLCRSGSFYGPDYRCCPLDWCSAIDIDTHDDLTLARAVLDLKLKQKEVSIGS